MKLKLLYETKNIKTYRVVYYMHLLCMHINVWHTWQYVAISWLKLQYSSVCAIRVFFSNYVTNVQFEGS